MKTVLSVDRTVFCGAREKEEQIMWACYIGEISEFYKERWEPHTVSPDQKSPDVYDVIDNRREIGYRLDGWAAIACFSDCVQVDWGGWAYKVTKEQILKYNREASHQYLLPEDLADSLDPDKEYAIIDVEIY